jgi:signal transduction histidine kinase
MPLTLYSRTTEPGGDQNGDGLNMELSPALRDELLAPAAWQEGLESYARAMHLGVILVNTDGRQLGPCLNPQPLWSLLRARQPTELGECPFALKTVGPCTCVKDSLESGVIVRIRDRTGIVHFTIPLLLGGERLGALIAGQVFDQYPEQLPLEQAAKMLDLSPAMVLEKARLEHPVRPCTLRVYENLLVTLGRTFLQSRYHAHLESCHLNQLRRTEAALRRVNDELERRVEERTTELRDAQTKALQAERLAAIGQMVAGLAHESRNALQRIQAGLTRLDLRLQEQPEALSLVNNIQKAQDDLHRLFEEVREYAAPIRLEPRPSNLDQVWREAWAELEPAREGREAELWEEGGGVDLHCVASPFHLKRVFLNLFHNALTAAGGPVRIVMRCSEAEVEGRAGIRVSVCDNGPGFARVERQKAFEPFFTTKVKGTGLGLPVSRRIVEAHGGKIDVGTDGGPGAEIVVTLPRRPS